MRTTDVQTGDVLLHRAGWKPMSWAIAALGRSPYSHAGMADWTFGAPVQLDTFQWSGARAVLLAEEVARKPGRIDVYRPVGMTDVQRTAAARRMWQLIGRPYGWRAMLRVALLRTPVLRLLAPVRWDVECDAMVPFCSMAVSQAFRSVGCDLVPGLADRFTEPGDLARSAVLEYQFTLE